MSAGFPTTPAASLNNPHDDLAEFQAYFDKIGIPINVKEVEIAGFIEVRTMPTGR
jgi:hypothetical protein